MVSALGGLSDSWIITAMSWVYAEYEPQPERISVDDPSPFLLATHADLYSRHSLEWLLGTEWTRDSGNHFPVGLWPLNHEWTLTAPLYSDSMYFSGEQSHYERLLNAGIEIMLVSRNDPLSSEGD